MRLPSSTSRSGRHHTPSEKSLQTFSAHLCYVMSGWAESQVRTICVLLVAHGAADREAAPLGGARKLNRRNEARVSHDRAVWPPRRCSRALPNNLRKTRGAQRFLRRPLACWSGVAAATMTSIECARACCARLWGHAMQTLRRPRLAVASCVFLSLICCGSVSAQMDFSGEWPVVLSQDNTDNPHLGEYVGIPLSREAIRRAEVWDVSIQSLPEWQCRPHSAAYIKRGPSNLRVWKEVDPASRQIVAFQTEWLRSTNTPIYMDGRPHPPEYAAHTWGGFSTGNWEGDRLRVETTHMKEDYYRRNGVPQSDRAKLTEYLMRRRFQNEDYLTWVVVAYDDVYLTEPLIRHRISAQPRATGPALPLHDRDGGRAARRLRAELAAWQERSDLQLLRLLRLTPRALLRRRRDDVSRVSPHSRAPRNDGRASSAGARMTMHRKRVLGLLRRASCSVAVAAVLLVGAPQSAPAQQRAAQRGGESAGDLHWWPVRKNIWMLVGAGTNIAASVGPDGVLLVNAGNAQASQRVVTAIKELQTQLNAFGFLDVATAQKGGAETRSRFPVNCIRRRSPCATSSIRARCRIASAATRSSPRRASRTRAATSRARSPTRPTALRCSPMRTC